MQLKVSITWFRTQIDFMFSVLAGIINAAMVLFYQFISVVQDPGFPQSLLGLKPDLN